jgi:hypothetical protein
MTEAEIYYKTENKYDYIDTIEKLEKLGNLMGVNNFYISGEHILFKLIEDKKDNFVKYFLKNNIDLNIKKKYIFLYKYLFDSKYIDYCIEKNIIRVENCYENDIPLIFEMIKLKKFEIVEKLLKQDFNVNMLYYNGNILYYLITNNHTVDCSDIIKILIAKKINLNEKNGNTDKTVLALAVEMKNIIYVELFLNNIVEKNEIITIYAYI